MVSFARARAKSWLSRLKPIAAEKINRRKPWSEKSNELSETISEQNQSFLKACKTGGIWFS